MATTPKNLVSSTAPPEALPAISYTDTSLPSLSTNNGDDNPGFAHDQLGSEDDGDEEDEEVGGGINGNKRRPFPTWLQNEFKEAVAVSSHRGPDGLPPLYRTNTFYFPQQSTYFILRNAKMNITPSMLYQYRLFLWDPEALVDGGLPCPICHTKLIRHQHINRPRRFVGIEGTIFMIGYRYRCTCCVNPKSNKCTVTFRSWDPRILKILPKALAAAFPATLTHRAGLSKATFMFMRSCFQHGMGSQQFANALRVQHLQEYDELHLQYLHHLYNGRQMFGFIGKTYLPFPPFEDRSSDGFGGYLPSSQYLRDLYDVFIESHRQEFNQHTAMLSANICAVDHSFKVDLSAASCFYSEIYVLLIDNKANSQDKWCYCVCGTLNCHK
jgi:hypothetical protein